MENKNSGKYIELKQLEVLKIIDSHFKKQINMLAAACERVVYESLDLGDYMIRIIG